MKERDFRLSTKRDKTQQQQLEQDPEYTDEQFHADLKKASKRLDAMANEALKEDAQGKTRKFPA